jgi:hypothetical protein
MSGNTIIYVPGIKPKPPAEQHRAQLWRCLLEGVRRAEPAAVPALAAHPECFEVAAWAPLFYRTQRDLALDLPGIERLLRLPRAEERDVRDAMSWRRRLRQRLYLLSDLIPPLMRLATGEEMRITLRDTMRYLNNEDGVAVKVRQLVADALLAAWRAGDRVLLAGHSLGSVIAYDVLWEFSYRFAVPYKVDLFLTFGSPLGLRLVNSRLLGAREIGRRRYPTIVRRWANLSAIGELTALDRRMGDHFGEMLRLGLVQSLTDDTALQNYFRNDDGLNVHKCYGYMVNPVLAGTISRWWLGEEAATGGFPSAG